MTNQNNRNQNIEDLDAVAGGSKDWAGEARQIPLPGNAGEGNQQDAAGANIAGAAEGSTAVL